jgi:hypothetical protein
VASRINQILSIKQSLAAAPETGGKPSFSEVTLIRNKYLETRLTELNIKADSAWDFLKDGNTLRELFMREGTP